MKILISANTVWNIYNFRLDLIKSLVSLGHEVIALAPKDDYVSFLEKSGIRCYNIKLNAKSTNPINDFSLLFQYYKNIKLLNPDIILSYTIKPNIYGNIAARLLKVPVINNISGLGTLFIQTSFATHVGKWLYKISLSSSKNVFFQNKYDLKLFIKNRIVKSKITSIVPGSGVNVKKFQCERASNKGAKFLFLGRLISDKGVFEYLNAAVSVLNNFPEKKFLLAGELGSNNNTAISKEQLKDFTENYRQINYLGKIDNTFSLLKSVDVVVLPSYREGLSKALIEAAAMNLPIITTNVPGCKDVVEHNFNGFICEVRSKLSLEKAIYNMINLTEKERLELGINGRKKIIKEFSSDIVTKIYISKINQIIKKERRK